jgi:hypothetical protein
MLFRILCTGSEEIYCHDLCVCDYGRGMDWRMDLLTTYTHDSELQAIKAYLDINSNYKQRVFIAVREAMTSKFTEEKRQI